MGQPLMEAIAVSGSSRMERYRSYWQGCSLAEIAEGLGRSVPAVAGLLHRGLKQLGQRLPQPD
jgi:DNA-directed RNA polymerase specialized sigma24 family protein